MDTLKFKEKYHEVFDDNGNIKPCGRLITKELISMCMSIEHNTDFGNDKTGFMNVENIKKLYDKMAE